MLGQDASPMKLRQPDTATADPSGSSSAGRTTSSDGNALIKARKKLKAPLIKRAGLLGACAVQVNGESRLSSLPYGNGQSGSTGRSSQDQP